jgi:hypothetical protein
MAGRCIDGMNRNTNAFGAGLIALLSLLTGACTSSSAASAPVQSAAVQSFAGGCAGTVLTDAVPPSWAQGGWSHAKGTPWPVHWASGTRGETVAYLFATQLVAGAGPRVDGSQNKVLWEAKDHPSGDNLVVEGHPLGQSQPVVTVAGGPSTVDVPTAGCWTFRLSWGANSQQSSTINLQVLPRGTNPMTLPSTPAG